ncbi:MAG: phosphate acetyltransferase [Granulosicoccus sp.]
MPIFDHVIDKARTTPRRIVLPEANDERILRAAVSAAEQGIALPILLGDSERIQAEAKRLELSLDALQLIDPSTSTSIKSYIELLVEKRAHRGMNAKKAERALADPITFACAMVAAKDAHGCVAGAVTATSKVVSNAMRYVGKRDGESLVSSCFLMLLEPHHPVKDVLFIADCALVIDPDAEQLASIAAATGATAMQLLGLEPQIAMLSFSTAGSARHATVSKITQATKLARARCPDWRIIGEVQLDAAVIPSVLARKSSEQAAEGPCNTLIFPNLDAGNIGYKLIERFGGAQAIGPILQGLNMPVNDLSRGCSTLDVLSIIAVTAAQVDA